MYADGTIVPIKSYKGVQFTQTQINDYVAGKTIRVDGCQGNHPTMYIKFDPDRMIPGVYSSNPDAPQRSTSTQSQGVGIALTSLLSEAEHKTIKVSPPETEYLITSNCG